MRFPPGRETEALKPKFELPVAYSDEFRRHYPVRGLGFDLDDNETEPEVVVWDLAHQRSAKVNRTRGDRYPYEEQKGVITVTGAGIHEPRILSAKDFRTIEVSWITRKLILITLGIGHIAGVDAIYDVEKDTWIYSESVSYNKNHGRTR